MRLRPTDRIVVLGEITQMYEQTIARSRAKTTNPPKVERDPGPTPVPAPTA